MKKPNNKQRNFSIRLKTSFAIQAHIDEFDELMSMARESGITGEEYEVLCKIMEEAIAESLKMIFPKPFEA
jgi:hypothetical protein